MMDTGIPQWALDRAEREQELEDQDGPSASALAELIDSYADHLCREV